jgi:hypothetical protein
LCGQRTKNFVFYGLCNGQCFECFHRRQLPKDLEV